METTVIPFDFARIFWGDAPPLFLAEIAFRTLFIYAYTLVLLRWIGGRSISQLSVVEFLLVIALGSAVGDALFYPEVPLFHAMLVITIVVVMDKLFDYAIRRFNGFKMVVDGSPVEVLRDGCILSDGMVSRALGDLELKEMLRTQGIENLGQVRTAYMEPSGHLSVIRAGTPRPGLAIVPPVELSIPTPPGPNDQPCCVACGTLLARSESRCPTCGDPRQTAATLPNTAAHA